MWRQDALLPSKLGSSSQLLTTCSPCLMEIGFKRVELGPAFNL